MLPNSLLQSLPFVAASVITICLSLTLIVISAIDLRTFRIPDLLSLPLIGAGLALALTVPDVYPTDHVIGATIAFALFAGLGELYFRVRHVDGLGLGDAKLFAAAGAWLGWQNLPMVLLIATLGGLAQALLIRTTRGDSQLAFGPWISLGFWATWLLTYFRPS